ETHTVAAEPHHTLLEVLRDDLALTGTKECCLVGECGACTVIMDGRSIDACLVLAVEAAGTSIRTVEGLAGADGRLSPLQAAFLDRGAVQCGFCIPGQLMSAQALLEDNPHPSHGEIEEGLAGNLCRCACYEQIFEAVQAVVDGESAASTVRAPHAAGGAHAGARSVAQGLDQ
ncbi:MAG: (2Fe-2S)-binding protein, partial [Candidatus Limnocylindrales bacterium]